MWSFHDWSAARRFANGLALGNERRFKVSRHPWAKDLWAVQEVGR